MSYFHLRCYVLGLLFPPWILLLGLISSSSLSMLLSRDPTTRIVYYTDTSICFEYICEWLYEAQLAKRHFKFNIGD